MAKFGVSQITIRTKTLIFLGILVVLIIFNYGLLLNVQNHYADNTLLVEISRRNEVLAQKLNVLINQIEQPNQQIQYEIESVMSDYDYNLNILEKGGEVILLNKRLNLPASPASVKSKLSEVQSLWKRYSENLAIVLHQAPLINSIDSTIVNGQLVTVFTKVVNQDRKQAYSFIQDNIVSVVNQNIALSDILLETFLEENQAAKTRVLWVFIAYLGLFITGYFFIIRGVLRPLQQVGGLVQKITQGDFIARLNYGRKDEIGHIIQDIHQLAESLQTSTDFATSIGQYQLDVPFKLTNEQDKLAKALLTMRENLKRVDEDSNRRRWMNEGVSLFNDILRNNFDNFQEFAYRIVYELVQYLHINQGSFFSMDVNVEGQQYLKLEATYAFDRRRFEEKAVDLQEGLLAQAVQEKASIYLTEIPTDYVKITSGLGDAPPRNLIIAPLISDNQVYGVIELASFQKLSPEQLDLINRICESVASTIANIRINQNTRELLMNAQEYAQRMQAQEEEMRQNMEELTATQEALEKREKDKTDALNHLSKEYDLRIEEMSLREKMLIEQKSQLQQSLDMANDKQLRAERQYEEARIAVEKAKNKESSMAFAIQEKDKEILALKKQIDELKNNR